MAELPKQDDGSVETAKLAWPPKRADLERFYLGEELSALKIAKLYGKMTANPILMRLRAEGIGRRDPAEINRKVTKDTIDRWISRYQAGESMQQIIGNTVCVGTMRDYLLKRGVPIRSTGGARRIRRMRRDAALFGKNGDEIKRLYLDERLSCLQIANRVGLDCNNEAKAFGIVYRRLKELGVKIQPRGFFSRKYDSLATDWARRYRAGESTCKIGNGEVSPSVVAAYLDELGVRRLDASEAHTRYPKVPFQGTEQDRAYLLGFTRGDLNVRRDHRLIVLRTGSTHPAQLDLFTSLFAPHGPIYIYPTISKRTGFEWWISAAVDLTFEFLLLQKTVNPFTIFDEDSLMSYLAGLFDAEGSLWIAADRDFAPRWTITNSDQSMLDWIVVFLKEQGFHAWKEPPTSLGVGRVWIWRPQEIRELLRRLPITHPEKKAKARLVIDEKTDPTENHARWNALRADIEHDRNEFIRASERELATIGRGATNSYTGFMASLRYLTHWRRFPLDESIWLEVLNWLGEYVCD